MQPRLHMERYLTMLAVLAATAMTDAVHAQQDLVPSAVNYQGTLFGPDGKTPQSGPVDLDIRLYVNKGDDPAAAAWGESHLAVALFEGVFNVTLGEGAAIDGLPHPGLDTAFAQSACWVGVTVAGEGGERAERQRLVSAPYALTADTAFTALHGVPAGTISVWAGNGADPPEGWLLCDGATLDGTAQFESGRYAALYSVIGTTWGGTGESSFNVPNFGGRALMGNSDSTHIVGDLLGEETHRLEESEIPDHRHDYTDSHSTGTDNWDPFVTLAPPIYRATTTTEEREMDATGGDAPHNNMQPSRVMTFIIKY